MEEGRNGPESKATREVRHEYTRNLPRILEHLVRRFWCSTYQAGKLVAVGAVPESSSFLTTTSRKRWGSRFARERWRLALGRRSGFCTTTPRSRDRSSQPGSTMPVSWQGQRESREKSRDTSDLAGEELWVVNTAFSCLCTLNERHSFRPLEAEVHLLAGRRRSLPPEWACIAEGRAKLVTALAETDEPGGWRPSKATTGCLIDVESGETLVPRSGHAALAPNSPGKDVAAGLGPRRACGG